MGRVLSSSTLMLIVRSGSWILSATYTRPLPSHSLSSSPTPGARSTGSRTRCLPATTLCLPPTETWTRTPVTLLCVSSAPVLPVSSSPPTCCPAVSMCSRCPSSLTTIFPHSPRTTFTVSVVPVVSVVRVWLLTSSPRRTSACCRTFSDSTTLSLRSCHPMLLT